MPKRRGRQSSIRLTNLRAAPSHSGRNFDITLNVGDGALADKTTVQTDDPTIIPHCSRLPAVRNGLHTALTNADKLQFVSGIVGPTHWQRTARLIDALCVPWRSHGATADMGQFLMVIWIILAMPLWPA
jgi:hypothetical protein